jgi:hypothetical protein
MFTKKALAASVSAAPAVYVEDVMSVFLYTGNGSTQTITNGIDLAGEGGLVWIKNRSNTALHVLTDTTRGVDKLLYSNAANAEASGTWGVNSFNATGFGITGSDQVNNTNTQAYASWTFRKAAKFFDVVTYTGTGSNRTIAHNLGSVPGCIIVKRTDTTGDWQVYHRSNTANPETDYLVLNSTAATADSDTRWNDTLPTSTVFSLGTEATVNASGGTYVAYLFAHDAGGFGDAGDQSVVKCGSFTTDGSGAGTISLGWEPQWVLFKRSDSATAGNWYMFDNMRGWTTGTDGELFANSSVEEGASNRGEPTSTGFTVANVAASGSFIYIAIRRGPMKTPTSGTEVFNTIARTGTGSAVTVTGVGFTPDLLMGKRRTLSDGNWWDRLRGAGKLIIPSATNAEATDNTAVSGFDAMDGVKLGDDTSNGYINGTSTNYANWFFRRAPGFFDVVAYTGTGSATTVSHNLGVVPELILIKARSINGGDWAGYSVSLGNTKSITLNWDGASGTTSFWNNTSPTLSVFTVATVSGNVNQSGETYIAYLFASCPGVSKVGSYTGTGTTLDVDCGFTAGARFVLIKRTDSTGDWFVWDTARGIISGNDPSLLLNSTAAEVTNTDYIDPLSSGFQISSTAPAAINASGGSFIFLAIA